MICKKLILFILYLSCAICSQNYICYPDTLDVSSRIYGTWKLKSYSGGIAAQTFYPEDDFTLTFEVNSDISIFKEYINDSLINIDTVNFDTCLRLKNNRTNLLNTIVTENDNLYLSFQDDNTLVIEEECCDRYTYTFIHDKTNMINYKRQQLINERNPSITEHFNIAGKKIIDLNRNLSGGLYFKSVKSGKNRYIEKSLFNY